MKYLIILLFLFSCGTPVKDESKKPNVYDGSLGVVLGCMFNPSDCSKYKKSNELDEKGWEEVDKQSDK